MTKRVIDELPANPRRYAVWDSEMRGFGVRVSPDGSKTFVLRYHLRGRNHWVALGRTGAQTVDEARRQARAVRVRVDRGEDPAAERRQARLGLTFGEFAAKWIDRAEKRLRRNTVENYRSSLKPLLAAWKSQRLDSIRRRDVAALHDRIGGWPGDNALKCARTIFADAVRLELIDANPTTGIRVVNTPARTARARPLTRDEVRRLVVAVQDLRERGLIDAGNANLTLLLLYTGMRRGEALGARWEHLDYERRSIYLPQSKSNRPQHVPLSSFAVSVLKDQQTFTGNQPYVFAGIRSGQHLYDGKRGWEAIARAAEFADVKRKDMRATVASWLQDLGYPLSYAAEVLRHSGSTVTSRHYTRTAAAPILNALERYGREIERAVNGMPAGADVVELRPGAPSAGT